MTKHDVIELEIDGKTVYPVSTAGSLIGLTSELIMHNNGYTTVFSGFMLFNGSQSVTWHDSEFKENIRLTFSQYDVVKNEPINTKFIVHDIPFTHVRDFNNMNYHIDFWRDYAKIVYPSFTSIKGHDVNGQGDSRNYVLRKVEVK